MIVQMLIDGEGHNVISIHAKLIAAQYAAEAVFLKENDYDNETAPPLRWKVESPDVMRLEYYGVQPYKQYHSRQLDWWHSGLEIKAMPVQGAEEVNRGEHLVKSSNVKTVWINPPNWVPEDQFIKVMGMNPRTDPS